MRMMARVEGMPLEALRAGLAWDWTSFGDWLDRLDGAHRPSTPASSWATRRCGWRRWATTRSAAARPRADRGDGRAARCRAGGRRDGVLDVAVPHPQRRRGEPVPSRGASREELVALAAAVRDASGHHARGDPRRLPQRASPTTRSPCWPPCRWPRDRPLNWNVLGVSAGEPDGHEKQLRASDVAAERGGRVVALTLPHSMRIRLSFLSGFVLDGLPGWREMMHLPVPERIEALADPEVRRRLDEGATREEAGILRGLANWERLDHRRDVRARERRRDGRTVGEVAKARGARPVRRAARHRGRRRAAHRPAPRPFGDDEADWRLRAEVWRNRER